ncbi:hypothetical protein GGS21DRAFT_320129 [Xylaria nigripes]|nr:hypothetical protein GGS21DRAFT_320129 [Xylaria nigripes]
MPTYHHDHDHRHRKEGYELAHHLSQELHHSARPTRYIINEGKLILSERSLDRHHRPKSNTIIYNSPGSTMWVQQSTHHHRHEIEAPHQNHHHQHHHQHQHPECRGCFRRRELYHGGYCADCVSARAKNAQRHELVTAGNRRVLEYPERKAIAWS